MTFPVNKPLITEEDIRSVTKALESTWISGESEIVNDFEEAFANSIGVKYAIATSNGSTALELAFAALDLKAGDEIILPSFTIISCLAPILRMGLKPIFVDSNLKDWNMNPLEVLEKITPKTRAILIVHIYGLSVDMNSIIDIAKQKDIFVIEDCAEAIGVEYHGKPCGSYGDIATFSFYTNKLITTGEGGMCVTSNPALNGKMKKLRNLGFEKDIRFRHFDLGYNFRLTGIQAALGISQLNRLSEHLDHKRSIAACYKNNFGKLQYLDWQPKESNGSTNSYWVFGLLIKESRVKADIVMRELESEGIGTRPFFFPLHKQPLLQNFPMAKEEQFADSSEYLSKFGFYLPSGNGINLEEINEISEKTIAVFKKLGIA